MNSSDKKNMLLIVFVTIFLGLIMIFFFKPDYSTNEIGAVVTGQTINEVFTNDFGELFEQFEEDCYSDVSFINEKT